MTTFTRQFSAKKGKHIISFICQPYIVGMYVALTDSKVSNLIQLSFEHKEFTKFSKSISAKLKKQKYKVETTEAEITNYLKESDLKEYNINL